MHSWQGSRELSATALRALLNGRDPVSGDLVHIDPRGVQLRGARIAERLDLDGFTGKVRLELVDCLLSAGLTFQLASLSAIILKDCLIEHATEPPLNGKLSAVEVLNVKGATVRGHCEDGAIDLNDARIGHLQCDDAVTSNSVGPAIDAYGCEVKGDVEFSKLKADVDCGAGAVRMVGARVGGQVYFGGADLHNATGSALIADRLTVGQNMRLCDGFKAVGTGRGGAVRLLGAHIGGQLICTGARIRNRTGPAFEADRIAVDGDAFLGGLKLFGESEALGLTGARIGGSLNCWGMRLRASTGVAVNAKGLKVAADLNFDGMKISCDTLGSAVELSHAHIRGMLHFSQARLGNSSGPALTGDEMRVEQSFFLNGTRMKGDHKDGTVSLYGARIDGDFICRDTRLESRIGPAFWAENMQIGKDLAIQGRFQAAGGSNDYATLILRGTRVGSRLYFSPESLKNSAEPQKMMDVDGLTYPGLPKGHDLDWWLNNLRVGAYAAQPYLHLAAVHREAGDDHKVRKILIEQKRRQRDLQERRSRILGHVMDVTLGYGYQSWRALLCLLGVTVIAVTLALTLGASGGLARPSLSGKGTDSCSVVQQVAVGLDRGLPLVKTGNVNCTTTDGAAGQALAASGYVLQGLAWAFSALFVVGFTGAVRKTS